ncbi:hypothetical protein ACLESD_49130 [Pyxidicoccus sp. 3LFB2]
MAVPAAKSRLPDAVRAAVAEIDLDVEVAPPEVTAGGAPVDLSSELPAELSVDVASGAPASSGEEVLHSVSVGLAYLVPDDAAEARPREGATAPEGDEPILMGEAVEEAEPIVEGQGVSEETDPDDLIAATLAPAPVHTQAPGLAGGDAPSPETARAATSSLPPGLLPRASQRIAIPEALRSPRPPAPAPMAVPEALPASRPPAPSPMADALPPVRTPSGKWKALSSPIADPRASTFGSTEPPMAASASVSFEPPAGATAPVPH